MALLEVYKVVEVKGDEGFKDSVKYKVEVDVIDTVDIKSARIFRPSKKHAESGIRSEMIRIYFKTGGEMTILEKWESFSQRANVVKAPAPIKEVAKD
jgi:hypothetical protein